MKKKPESGGETVPDTQAVKAEIRARAIGLLTRREHSVLELERKLRQRGYPADIVASVVQTLKVENLLSETRFAQEWVRARVARGQGPLKLRAGLRQQGLDDAQIQEAIAEADPDWGQLAVTVRCKRFGAAQPHNLMERARQTRFLESRGFAAEHVRQALGAAPQD